MKLYQATLLVVMSSITEWVWKIHGLYGNVRIWFINKTSISTYKARLLLKQNGNFPYVNLYCFAGLEDLML